MEFISYDGIAIYSTSVDRIKVVDVAIIELISPESDFW